MKKGRMNRNSYIRKGSLEPTQNKSACQQWLEEKSRKNMEGGGDEGMQFLKFTVK